LQRLFTWREETARAADKPRGHIIPDAALLAIAQQPPSDAKALPRSGLSSQAISRYGAAIVSLCAASETASEMSEMPPLATKNWRLSAPEKEMYQRLREMIEQKSQTFAIDAALIGNSDELRHIARFLAGGTPPTENLRQFSGWRRLFLEDFLPQGV
jgi:ribonuclease D